MRTVRPAFIALGSNIAPEQHLVRAHRALSALGPIRRRSTVYRTSAIGPQPAPDYLNLALWLDGDDDALALRQRLRAIEAVLGRVRTEDKYVPRPIDLDLCLLGDLVLNTPELVLPDPDLLERPYLAACLAELDPDFVHPVTGESLAQIAARLTAGAVLQAVPDLAWDKKDARS